MDEITKKLVHNDQSGTWIERGALVFYSSGGDFLIRLGSGGRFSHVAISLGEGNRSVEARWPHGVQYGSAWQQMDFEARMLPADAIETAIFFAQKYLGKTYDLLGWLSVLFRRNIGGGGPPNAFHCSSLIALAWFVAGQAWKTPTRCVSPQDVFNAADALVKR